MDKVSNLCKEDFEIKKSKNVKNADDCLKAKIKQVQKSDYVYIRANFWITLTYFVFALLLEFISFGFMGLGTLPTYWLYDVGIVLVFCGLGMLMPHMLTKQIIFTVLLVLQTVLNIVNKTLFDIFGSVFTLNMLKLGAEATTAFSFSFLNPLAIACNLLVCSLALWLIFCLPKYDKKVIKLKKISKFALILIAFLIIEYNGAFAYALCANTMTTQKDTIVGDDQFLYKTLFLPTEAYKKFGTFGYYTNAFAQIVDGKSNLSNTTEFDEYRRTINSGYGFEEQTDMSAVLDGYNVVEILFESFDTFAINPVFTPTLYAMQQKSGMYFDNFFGRNKTNVSEAISIIGSYPSERNAGDLVDTVGISTPYSFANLFKQDALQDGKSCATGYFHTNDIEFYNRDKTHAVFGFDNLVGIKEMYGYNPTACFDDHVLDTASFELVIDQILPTDVDRFYSYITTFTTHGSYDYKVEAFEQYEQYVDEHYDELCVWLEQNGYVVPTDEKFEGEFKCFLARTIDADNLVGMLVEQCEARGLLNNTLFVMFSDHAPYYNDLGLTIKGHLKSEYYIPQLNNIPFMIYSTGLEPQKISKFCSHYDIMPTMCDLLGIKYNSALCQGRSVFADESQRPSMFASFLSGIYNDELYSSNIQDILYPSDISNISEQKLAKFQSDAEKFYINQLFIDKIWKYNLCA